MKIINKSILRRGKVSNVTFGNIFRINNEYFVLGSGIDTDKYVKKDLALVVSLSDGSILNVSWDQEVDEVFEKITLE